MQKISKIYHIADTHIRTFKRHSEYEEVFQKLYDYIRKTKDDDSIIFLGGDIVHSKIEMTPELIKMTSSFLKNCADLCETILICGNHDANLNNVHRLDALSPIVDNLNHPNLHYWKSSGVYNFRGHSFSVFSLLGKPEEWISAKDVNSSGLKIALHHGPVFNPDSIMKFEPGPRSLSNDRFNGFDLVLLGDLHWQHFTNKDETIGYPGSLICQSYGEPAIGHGILVWDLKTKKSTFVEIQNDYGYFTLIVSNGEYNFPGNLPKKLRLRVKYENTSQDELTKIISKIGKKHQLIEVTKQKITTKQAENRFIEFDNPHDINYQRTLIEELLITKYNVSSSIIKQVQDLHDKYIAFVTKMTTEHIWIPKRLEFSNMFSFGEDNVLDFTQMSGVYGVCAPNAQGKSSFLEIICYVLFDKSTRASKGINILNNKKDNFYCKLLFELNGSEYTIIRAGKKDAKGNVRVDVEFYQGSEDDIQTTLTGADRDETNKIIRSYVGFYEDYIMTAYSSQYDNQSFIEKSQRDRKDLLARILDIGMYDKLYNLVKDEIKERSAQTRGFDRGESHNKLSEIHQKLTLSKEKQQSAITTRDKYSILRDTIDNDILELTRQIQTVPFDKIDIQKVELDSSAQLEKISSFALEIQNLQRQIIELETEVLNYEKHEDPRPHILEIEKEIQKLNLEILRIDNDLKLLNSTKSTIATAKKHLNEHEYDPNCEFCLKNPFVVDAKNTISKLPGIESKFEELTKLKDNLIQSQTKLTKRLNIYIDIKDLYCKRLELISKIESLRVSIETEKSKGQAASERYKSLEQTKRTYYENAETIQRNSQLEFKISSLQEERKSLNEILQNSIEQERISYSSILTYQRDWEQVENEIERNLKIQRDIEIYEHYQNCLSRDGIQYLILQKILPVIEMEVNDVLNQTSNFTIKLESEDSKNIVAYIDYGNGDCWPVELTSGMERFTIATAFRVALSEITNLSKANFLAIDEGFGVLDAENIQNLNKLFDFIRTKYNFVLVISHIEAMKDLFDNQIYIHKEGGYSKLDVND